jgi:DNA-binding NtrC family response regulator
MPTGSVLIVDDEPDVREIVAAGLSFAGFAVFAAPNGRVAIELARQNEFHVAIVDLSMPGLSGMDTARRLRELTPDTEIIICTGRPSLETAIESIRENVFDYILKPVTSAELRRAVQSAIERYRSKRSRDQEARFPAGAPGAASQQTPPSVLVGETQSMAQVRRLIGEVAPSDMTVLIRGETGTGKDLVAHLIHRSSRHAANGSFVKVNCPAIPETLLESELFGHEMGAFTGAQRRKPGRFELAGQGTVFLDEIGAIPISAQAKLLQAIETRQFTRLGGAETICVDARFVAATNEPLEQFIESGEFRPDLFYRLNEFCIHLPPLRHRPQDIPLLVRHFLCKHGPQGDAEPLQISPPTMSLLLSYSWPGNVRELETVVKRFTLTRSETSIQDAVCPTSERQAASFPGNGKMRETEIQTILSALESAKWNQRRASEILGISYSALRRRMAKYDIKP